MDRLTILGIIFGIGAVLLGQYLEGGQLKALMNFPALVIVLGGTLGAVLVQTPWLRLRRSLQIIKWVFKPPRLASKSAIDKLVTWNTLARKDGLLALEESVTKERDLFIRKGLDLVISSATPEMVRQAMEMELEADEYDDLLAANVFESMGSYAPTLGILGAVLGLIQVLGDMNEPSELGAGIAVAFVATLYGVGFANLLFIPIANKLKMIVRTQSYYREILIEGICAIAEGESPSRLKMRLTGLGY